MNYRHDYHAGNFADVLKHISLMLLLKSLQRKEAPYCYIDTHAGQGSYDLDSAHAVKTLEAMNGIQRLRAYEEMPEPVANYLNLVERYSSFRGSANFYPGSPLIAQKLARPQDRLVFNEAHPEVAALLRAECKLDRRVHLHQQNAYQVLKGWLPPKERRGLVLIDPPYEDKNEYANLAALVIESWQRWPTGIYAIWYPISPHKSVATLVAALRQAKLTNVLNLSLSPFAVDSPVGLNGSGLIVINPPWKFDLEMAQLLPWLWKALSENKAGGYELKWLMPQT